MRLAVAFLKLNYTYVKLLEEVNFMPTQTKGLTNI